MDVAGSVNAVRGRVAGHDRPGLPRYSPPRSPRRTVRSSRCRFGGRRWRSRAGCRRRSRLCGDGAPVALAGRGEPAGTSVPSTIATESIRRLRTGAGASSDPIVDHTVCRRARDAGQWPDLPHGQVGPPSGRDQQHASASGNATWPSRATVRDLVPAPPPADQRADLHRRIARHLRTNETSKNPRPGVGSGQRCS